MKKVIIITRKTGYIDNNGPIKDREKFVKAILDSDSRKYSGENLIRFLSALKFTKCDNYREKIEKGYNIKIQSSTDEKEVIKILLENKDFPKVEDRFIDDFSYVSFNPDDDKEIILVLWDELKDMPDEKVKCFELFIEAICKDCGVEEQSNDANKAILYIHDKQFGIDKDETIVPGCKHTDEPYVTLKKYFYYVAAFRHDSSGIFQSQILKFDFPISMKTKVIIITRSSEYIEYNKIIEGKGEYGTPILDELNNKTNYSENKDALKRMLLLRRYVDSLSDDEICEKVEKYEINIAEYEDKDGEELKKELKNELVKKIAEHEDKDDEDLKKELVKKIAEYKDIRCYVSFEHDNYEIVLLLWDKLNYDEKKIEPFELFIEAICKDCGVEEQSNDANKAILYIHDKQFGIDKDETIVPGCKHTDEPYVTLKKYFYYVAAFQHISGGIFQSEILEFNFPSSKEGIGTLAEGIGTLAEGIGTLAERIDRKVSTCNTAEDWRNESDAIIQNSMK